MRMQNDAKKKAENGAANNPASRDTIPTGEVLTMESILEKDHNRPAHNSLNTDKTKTDAESTDRRMNEIANKAAGKGLERQRQDESDKNIFTK